jgi:hypothetical protein
MKATSAETYTCPQNTNSSLVKKIKLFSGSKFLMMFSALFFTVGGIAQIKKYRENQVINIGSGQTLKVLTCKGEGAQQECELRHYVNNKQVGNTFWLTANGIAMQQNARRTKPAAPQTKTQSLPVQNGIATARNAGAIKKLTEAPVSRLPIAQTQEVVQPVVSEKHVTTMTQESKDAEPAKKVKKEFVSHNPFLNPKYKGNQTASKQSVDSSKTN